MMLDKKIFVIGIGCIARVGKDTLANCLKDLFKENYNCIVRMYSLATVLKNDLRDFIQEKYSLNVWTNNSIEKELFRDLLVAHGKVQRKRTEGRYWINIVNKNILTDASVLGNKNVIFIIPDIRYCEHDKDEVFWLKNELNGCLINLDRIQKDESLIQPANEDELKNYLKIKEIADFNFIWPTLGNSITRKYYDLIIPLFEKLSLRYKDFLERE